MVDKEAKRARANREKAKTAGGEKLQKQKEQGHQR